MNDLTSLSSPIENQLIASGITFAAKRGFQFIKGVFNEIGQDLDTGTQIEEILKDANKYEIFKITMEYIKDHAGLTDDRVSSILKALLIKFWKLSKENNDESEKVLQFAEISKDLKANEVRILFASYKAYIEGERNSNVDYWESIITQIGGFSHTEIVRLSRYTLQKKLLITTSTEPGHLHKNIFPEGNQFFGLTKLGFDFCQSIYTDVEKNLNLEKRKSIELN